MGEDKKARYALAYIKGEMRAIDKLMEDEDLTEDKKGFLEKHYNELKQDEDLLNKQLTK